MADEIPLIVHRTLLAYMKFFCEKLWERMPSVCTGIAAVHSSGSFWEYYSRVRLPYSDANGHLPLTVVESVLPPPGQ
uniref:Uncharacterized protein n=1 Tax=Anguilla anguilla TaxID=7936 RepID=A0A0E9WYS3_ANGAN